MLTTFGHSDSLILSLPVLQDNPRTASPSPPLIRGNFFTAAFCLSGARRKELLE